MKKCVFILLLLASGFHSLAQSRFEAVIKDSATGEPLLGATVMVKGTSIGGSTDNTGAITLYNIPDGEQTIVVRYIGYHEREVKFMFPVPGVQSIYLVADTDELGEVIIEGTRSNKSIADEPTRVEVLTEEIDEASTMDPSKIAHLITHSTGIQVQQTSATSNTANVRIQGLDGRYTQILKDGFPLYGGFSGSLSIMQIPPLDLRQVEYIKGGSSTLYGGGAISGMINLISKEPQDEMLFHVNASHIGAFDVNTFVGRREGKFGFTLLGQRNTHRWFDADNDGYSDMPQLTKYNLNPKLFFFFNPKTTLSIGATFTDEIRQGGDVQLMNHEPVDSIHFYKEINDISRITTQLKFAHKFGENSSFTLRNSFNLFHRRLEINPSLSLQTNLFSGQQFSSFSEVAWSVQRNRNVLIAGINFYTDKFTEDLMEGITPNTNPRDESYQTIGAFANFVFDVGKKITMETGLRSDYVFGEDFFLLPRVSVLFKWTEKLTTRIGGGMGYRNPTIFNQEAELFGYLNVAPIDKNRVSAEESFGGNADVGYKTNIGENYFIIINQMFFFTRLNNPLVLADIGSFTPVYEFVNADGYTESYGGETFFKLGFYDFVFFAGYTYTHATNHFSDTVSVLTLTPMHSLKGDLLYALPGKWRIGLDYEFKSSQTLSDGRKTREYWTYGAVVEYTWTNFTFFGNVENYTNVRQTRYESLLSGPYNTPQFTEVWAPLDGIVFNGGIKIRL